MSNFLIKCSLCAVFFCSLFAEADSLDQRLDEIVKNFEKNAFFIIINDIKKERGNSRIDKKLEELILKNDYMLGKNEVSYIKIECANYLLQRKKNQFYNNDKVFRFVYKELDYWLSSNDIDVKLSAIDLLGLIDINESFIKLINFIKDEDPLTFRRAGYAIQLLCVSYDEKEYSKVLKNLSKKNQYILNEYKNGLRKFYRSNGWCEGHQS